MKKILALTFLLSSLGMADDTGAVAQKFLRLQQTMGTQPAPRAGAKTPSGEGAPAAAYSEPRSLPVLALEVGAALLFVLGAAVVSIRLLRKAQRGMLSKTVTGGELLEVVETCHLGPQQKLVAVRMGGKINVVGVTREGLSLIATLDQPAGDILVEKRRQGNPAQFAENLNRMLDRFKKPKKVSEFPPA